MQLILLRHGQAEDSHPGGDSLRPLTEKGYDQARRQADRLAKVGKLPEIVLTSPLVRAKQTAESFCEQAGLPGPVVQGWIACGMKPETAVAELAGFSEFKRVALVGHEPDLSRLISFLIGSTAAGIQMKKGGIACLQVSPPARQGTLKYLIPPAL